MTWEGWRAARTRDGGNHMVRRALGMVWAAIALASVAAGASAQDANNLRIVNIRVGQGDSTLILGPAAPDGKRVSVLIDAGDIPSGGDPDGGRIVGAVLFKHGVDALDFFVASHYDADHIGGAITGSRGTHGHSFLLGPNGVPGEVGDDDGDGISDWDGEQLTDPDREELGQGDDVRAGTFVDRGDDDPPSSATYRKYLAMASAAGTRVSLRDRAEVEAFSIDLGSGATLRALAANGFVRGRAGRVPDAESENERSLCFHLRHGGFDMLICGDLIGRSHGSEDAEVESAVADLLVSEGVSIDVLHVNHHGANNGSAEDFVERIDPEIAVISLGNDNDHGHPHPDALRRLVNAGVYRIIQTSWGTTSGSIPADVRRHQAIYQSDIVIETDGAEYEISTARTFEVDE